MSMCPTVFWNSKRFFAVPLLSSISGSMLTKGGA